MKGLMSRWKEAGNEEGEREVLSSSSAAENGLWRRRARPRKVRDQVREKRPRWVRWTEVVRLGLPREMGCGGSAMEWWVPAEIVAVLGRKKDVR
ncbi:hypothetical protein U1Q18_018579 [Sarracenia purpurea var. burkii]